MPAGRPTKYKEEYSDQAYKLCLLGATDADLADFFGIQESTLNLWKGKHPEFMESLKDGREVADAQVAKRLYNRAMGYEHEDTHITHHQGEIIKTPIRKYYPPDTTACIFWLKNRQRGKWRDKQETEIIGETDLNINVSFVASDKND